MSEAERRTVVEYGIRTGQWRQMADTLRDTLVAARSGPDSTGPGWAERLWLATVFQWLATPEAEFGQAHLLPRLDGRLRNDNGPIPTDKLRQMIRQALTQERDNANFQKLLRRFFPTEKFWPTDQPLGRRLAPDTLRTVLMDPELVQELARTVRPGDYLPGVFQVLDDLLKHNANATKDSPALVVALAVVYDQALPPTWPHHQVSRSDIPVQSQPWIGLLDYFLQRDEAGDLLHDLDDLEADRLKFLVDAPVDLKELEWARQNVKTSRSGFDGVYRSVRYLNERIKDQRYSWSGGPYTLANIEEVGGICVDQAYFAAMVGKAHGLPTLYFSGQGNDGGHAWVGYLRSKDRWETDVGRYATQNYVVGHAMDPQSWERISDHQLKELTRARPDGYRNRKSIRLLALADLLGEDAALNDRLELLDEAIGADLANAEVWLRKTELLRDANAKAYLITHLQDMAERFRPDEELSTDIQRELAQLHEQNDEPQKAQQVRDKIISSMRRKRPDLAIRAAADSLAAELRAEPFDGFKAEYRKMIKRFASGNGGALFYHLIRPTVTLLAKEGQNQLAAYCMDYAQEKMRPAPEPGSILFLDFAALRSQLQSGELAAE